ncbi:MAG: hypothetical protein ACTSO7_15830, partial [Candidatus Heimdallarchaeota archaeon]
FSATYRLSREIKVPRKTKIRVDDIVEDILKSFQTMSETLELEINDIEEFVSIISKYSSKDINLDDLKHVKDITLTISKSSEHMKKMFSFSTNQ